MSVQIGCHSCGRVFAAEHRGQKRQGCPFCGAELAAQGTAGQQPPIVQPIRGKPVQPPPIRPAPAGPAQGAPARRRPTARRVRTARVAQSPAGGQGARTQVGMRPLVAAPPRQQAEGGPRSAAPVAEHANGISVNMLTTALVALGVTGAIYGVLFLTNLVAKGTALVQLFTERGWVPYVVVYMAAWSASILVVKWRRIRNQKYWMRIDSLPESMSHEIRRDNVDGFRRHVAALADQAKRSFIIVRVSRALDHFRSRGRVQDVAQAMTSQAEIDANTVESSYTIVKVLIWAMPILGFIGTVIGIGSAVSGFSDSMEGAQEFDTIRNSLGGVTGGLAVAFDTTLVALVMSLLIMLPARTLQKGEEDVLNSLDEFVQEKLIPRLVEEGTEEQAASGLVDPREAIEAMLKSHAGQMQELSGKIGSLARDQGQAAHRQWVEFSDRMREMSREIGTFAREHGEAALGQWSRLSGEMQARQEKVCELFEKAVRMQAQATSDMGRTQQDHVEQFKQAVGGLSDDMKQVQARSEQLQTAGEQALKDITAEFAKTLGGVSQQAAQAREEMAGRLADQAAAMDRTRRSVEASADELSGHMADVRLRYTDGLAEAAGALGAAMQNIARNVSSPPEPQTNGSYEVARRAQRASGGDGDGLYVVAESEQPGDEA